MSDSEYEEEEILVFADFKNQLPSDELGDITSSIKIIGLDTDNPIAEVNGNLFKGTHDYALGTNLFFEKDDTPRIDETFFDQSCSQLYKYFGKSNKVIHFQRMFAEPNTEEMTETTAISDDKPTTSAAAAAAKYKAENDIINRLRTNLTYEEAIKMFPIASDLKRREVDEDDE